MNAVTHRLRVRGLRVVTRTPRRYIAVIVRPEDQVMNGARYVAFAEVIKRTDSLKTARTALDRHGFAAGVHRVVIDTTTGEEV